MDLFPKFIIEDGNLILSKVIKHKHLVTNKEKVKGGGWFRFNSETNTFIFYESSVDFGKATFEDISNCVKNKKVFTNVSLIHNISEKHNFCYDTGSEIINIEK